MAASKTYSAQKALNTCPYHEHVEIEMYCKSCKKPLCTNCVKSDHRGHDWETMMTIAKTLRKHTSQQKLEIESVSKSILAGIGQVIKSLTSEAESEMELNSSELESKRKGIVDFVNASFEAMKSKCKRNHKAKMKNIKKCKEKLESKGRRINFLIQNMEIGAKDYTDYDLIELHDEISRLLNELQDLAVLPHGLCERMVYRQGFSDVASLESLIGSVEVGQLSHEAVLEKEFKTGSRAVISINPLSENEAWIRCEKFNKLFDTTGNIKRVVDLECPVYNFAVSEDGITYFCDIETPTVRQIDTYGKTSSLFSTAPLIPLFINITRSSDLLISLADEDSNYRNSSSRRLVRRVSMIGEAIMDYEFDDDGKTPLFCLPMNPQEHFNGNICVVNEYRNKADECRGTILAFDYRGKVLFKYKGMDDDFNPKDICCDNECNTLASDSNNKRIHLIDSNGTFLRYLLTEKSFSECLYAIALFGNKLWIGSAETGLVKVFKFKY